MKSIKMFTSADCVPCKQIKMNLKNKGYDVETIEMISVDSDEGSRLAGQYAVYGVPTTLFLENDSVVESVNGNTPVLSEKIINWK